MYASLFSCKLILAPLAFFPFARNGVAELRFPDQVRQPRVKVAHMLAPTPLVFMSQMPAGFAETLIVKSMILRVLFLGEAH